MISTKRAQREAKQLFRLCLVDGMLEEGRTRQVAQSILTAGYRSCAAILTEFLRLVRLDQTQHAARVESAVPLPPDLRAGIETSLTRRYGPGLTIVFADRPALIGGVRIQVGSNVYDGSILARLTALEKNF
jgi:F-type H+-transporting ATPase subunit delta